MVLTTALSRGFCYCPHFTDEATVAHGACILLEVTQGYVMVSRAPGHYIVNDLQLAVFFLQSVPVGT